MNMRREGHWIGKPIRRIMAPFSDDTTPISRCDLPLLYPPKVQLADHSRELIENVRSRPFCSESDSAPSEFELRKQGKVKENVEIRPSYKPPKVPAQFAKILTSDSPTICLQRGCVDAEFLLTGERRSSIGDLEYHGLDCAGGGHAVPHRQFELGRLYLPLGVPLFFFLALTCFRLYSHLLPS